MIVQPQQAQVLWATLPMESRTILQALYHEEGLTRPAVISGDHLQTLITRGFVMDGSRGVCLSRKAYEMFARLHEQSR